MGNWVTHMIKTRRAYIILTPPQLSPEVHSSRSCCNSAKISLRFRFLGSKTHICFSWKPPISIKLPLTGLFSLELSRIGPLVSFWPLPKVCLLFPARQSESRHTKWVARLPSELVPPLLVALNQKGVHPLLLCYMFLLFFGGGGKGEKKNKYKHVSLVPAKYVPSKKGSRSPRIFFTGLRSDTPVKATGASAAADRRGPEGGDPR